MEKTSPSDVKQRIKDLFNSSTPIETKKSIVEFFVSLTIRNSDSVEVVKEGDGLLILTNLFRTTNDFELKTKISTLLYYLSLTGHKNAATEHLMNEVNVLSLVNLLSEKDFHVFMQAFSGLKVLAEDSTADSDSSSSSCSSSSKSTISFSLSAAALFLDNISTLINPSSKQLSDMQKTELLGSFTQFAASGVMAQAAADAAKDSDSPLSKSFALAYQKFVKNLEGCHTGKLSLLDLVATQILQLIKDGKLIAAVTIPDQRNDKLDIINKWLGGSKKFVLLYQMSKDGLATSVFHQKCDNKGATVTIITSSEGYVFGGYSVLPWTSSGTWGNDTSGQSFLFSIINPRNGQPTKFALTSSGCTIYCNGSYGPTFGGNHDITTTTNSQIGSNAYTNLGHSYSNSTGLGGETVFTGSRNFTLKELEVYQVQ